MNTSVRPALAALAVLAAATPAFAQPGEELEGNVIIVTPQVVTGASELQPPIAPPPPAVAPIAPPAPQTDRWEDVSHINGSLVPVGERGNYLKKWKKTNLATNPIGWMFGVYGVSASHAISNNVAIRGDATLYSFESTRGYELGATLPIYFKRVYQGPFFEPGVMIRSFESSYDCYDYSGCMSEPTAGPQVMFGWHWTFDSGLNVAAAFGAVRNMNQTNSYGENVEPAGYFRIGYAY